MRRLGAALMSLAVTAAACNDGSSTGAPLQPSPTATPQPDLRVTENVLTVVVGGERQFSFTASNAGPEPITVTDISVAGLPAQQVTLSWSNGEIPPGGTQVVVVTLRPPVPPTFSALIRISGSQRASPTTLTWTRG